MFYRKQIHFKHAFTTYVLVGETL